MSSVEWYPGQTLEDLEKEVIKKAMVIYEGKKPTVARTLGISIKTLYNKLNQWGIPYGKGEEDGLCTEAGNDVESFEKDTEEQSVSLPVGNQVQKMLPEQDATHSSKGKRGKKK